MSNWDKDLFIDHMREQCNREIAKVGVMIIEFTEKHADDFWRLYCWHLNRHVAWPGACLLYTSPSPRD